MAKYEYKAQLMATGMEVEGVAEAADKFELSKNMKAEGKMLLTAHEITRHSFSLDRINAMLSRVDLKEKILFANNLGTMIEAGLPLARALQIFLKQTKNPRFRGVLQSLIDDINNGTALSDALEKYDNVFPPVFISMVRAGEESGGLVEALKVVGSQMEKTYYLKKKVKGAMLYPAIIFTVMIGVGVLMMMYVVPGLAQTFQEANVELPALTQILIAISDFLQNDWLLAIVLVFVMVGLFVAYRSTAFGKRSLNYIAIKVPVFGSLVREYNAALVTRTLSSLISAGVDIVRAIEVAQGVVNNVLYSESLDEAKSTVQKGIPLSQTFIKRPHLYPVMVGDMMEVGEETGKLSDMLYKIATFYEEEVDAATSDMSKLIEPILMVVIAAGVGVFAYAMITPMYSLMNSI